jgi:2-methylisocitrate lyase-like PEP mutase family enzyme
MREYEAMGVSSIYRRSRAAKKCGHMEGKRAIEQKAMVNKIERNFPA